MLVNFTSLLCV